MAGLEYEIATCRGKDCGRPIIWAATGKGLMPVDAEPSEGGNVELTPPPAWGAPVATVHAQPPLSAPGGLRMPHHATCPNADDFRGARR